MLSIRRPLAALPVAVLFVVGCQGDATSPPVETVEVDRPTQQYTVGDFLDTTAYAGASFSPDKSKVLVSSDATGVWNVYEFPVAGGPSTQLTSSEADSVFAIGYFPNDERFLYTSDQGGNELNHLFVRELDGSVQDLTPGESLKAGFAGWALDGESFYVLTNERDSRFFDVYELQADGYARELLYENNDGYQFADISPDRRYLAFAKANHNADTDIFLYDREAQEMTHLTPHEGDVTNTPMGFTPDGGALLFTTDEGSEYQYLVRHDLTNGERKTLVETDWDVMWANVSHDGTYLVVGINNDAKTEVRLFDFASMERRELPEVANAEVRGLRFSRDESMMAYYASSSRQPGDLYVQAVDGEPVRLTTSLSERIDAEDMIEGEVVRFASFDGVEIPGVLYTPHQARKEGAKLPALVWVHGGPGGQSRVGYNALIQFLVNHGYVVYAINNRGSAGYGKTFFHLDDRDHGKGDLGDCVASKDMLIDTGYVDPERIGIIGGSYGGYMVLAALTFRPDEFNVGVNLFGVSNWVRTTQSIPAWWEAGRRALERELGDFDDTEYLESISPLFHAQNIVRPLMVLQGANDPRVIQPESDDIVAAARANGVPVEYLVFEDEGHGFRKKENRAEGYTAILGFVDQYLKHAATEPAAEPDAATEEAADAA